MSSPQVDVKIEVNNFGTNHGQNHGSGSYETDTDHQIKVTENSKKRKQMDTSSPPGDMSPLHPSDSHHNHTNHPDQHDFKNKNRHHYTNGHGKKNHHKKQKSHIDDTQLTKEEIHLVEKAIDEIREGKFVVVVDDESRENEGDLILAAEKATTEKIAFMVNETSGLICVGCQGSRLDDLRLPQMVDVNTENHQTAFTVSVDYKIGTTTGISASDRAKSFRAMADVKAKPEDFARPGHIFPLRAKSGGVLERPGHTETAVDLCRYAGVFPAGVLSEIVNKDGSMKRLAELKIFASEHSLTLISVNQLIKYRHLQPFPDSEA
jgi:3,4-dihydroxy-2-butanone 4-phosphate synthase